MERDFFPKLCSDVSELQKLMLRDVSIIEANHRQNYLMRSDQSEKTALNEILAKIEHP